MKNILLIPHVKIHNANALSSPYTIGFPAMTAWLGAVHALERKLKYSLQEEYYDLCFNSVAVVCFDMELHTYRGHGDYVYSIIGTGNPLDKDGKRSPFIEEARCRLDVSLVIEYDCEQDGDLSEHVDHCLPEMKMAGGDIMQSGASKVFEIYDRPSRQELIRQLMPGFCLIERRDLMIAAMADGLDAIDALLDYLKVTYKCQLDENNNAIWTSGRKEKGWIVPIATGFQGVSDLGKAQHQRDPNVPHRFAESIVTLGEFVMPYRIRELDNMLWHYHVDLEDNLYICQQNKLIDR
jgi:CRISPR-associated protein Csy2